MSNETPAEVLADVRKKIKGSTAITDHQVNVILDRLERALAAGKVAQSASGIADVISQRREDAQSSANSGVPRPSSCRNALKDSGKAYPRSGCAVCGNGGLMGCPYDRKHATSAPPADPAKASGSAPDGFVMMPRASVEMLADIEVEDIDDPNGPGWTECPACGESASGMWKDGKYQRPTIPHNFDCPAEAARKALATPPASAPEVTDQIAERVTDYLCEQDYDIGGREELLSHVRAALQQQEGKSHG